MDRANPISSARLQNLRIPTANTVYFSFQQGLGGKQRPAWVSQTTLPHDSTKLHFPPKAHVAPGNLALTKIQLLILHRMKCACVFLCLDKVFESKIRECPCECMCVKLPVTSDSATLNLTPL